MSTLRPNRNAVNYLLLVLWLANQVDSAIVKEIAMRCQRCDFPARRSVMHLSQRVLLCDVCLSQWEAKRLRVLKCPECGSVGTIHLKNCRLHGM